MRGRDPLDGSDRFTFGVAALGDGIPFIAVIIGLFGITEIFSQIAERGHKHVEPVKNFGRWWPNRAENRSMIKPIAMGSAVGTVVGILPAAGEREPLRPVRIDETVATDLLEGVKA